MARPCGDVKLRGLNAEIAYNNRLTLANRPWETRMMRHARKLVVSILMLLGCPALAPATTLYKWVDDEGEVHYSARPPLDRPAQTLKAPPYRDTAQSTKDAPPLRGEHAGKGHKDKEGQERETLEPPPSKAQVEVSQHNCEIAKRNLDVLASPMRVQVTDSDGNPYFLDDKERAQRLAQTEKNIEKYCN
jgi:hypothetical protein